MQIYLKTLEQKYVDGAISVWNEVVQGGMAFPQTELLTEDSGRAFFLAQTATRVAVDESDQVVGVYILHPNNVGRCGHISNASYAVASACRGCGIGEKLVLDCIEQAKAHGFRILQFNEVVAGNHAALSLYKKLGFVQLGVIPKGFLNKQGIYEDIIPHYLEL